MKLIQVNVLMMTCCCKLCPLEGAPPHNKLLHACYTVRALVRSLLLFPADSLSIPHISVIYITLQNPHDQNYSQTAVNVHSKLQSSIHVRSEARLV